MAGEVMSVERQLAGIGVALDDVGAPRLSSGGQVLSHEQRVRSLIPRLVQPGDLLVRADEEGTWTAERTRDGVQLIADVGGL